MNLRRVEPVVRPGGGFWTAGIVMVSAVLLALFWAIICTVPSVPWSVARLAPSFALARGLPIYALRDSGAHLGWFYGPVFPLWYLPVAWTDNPTYGIMAAGVLNTLTLLVPIYACLRAGLDDEDGRTARRMMLPTVVLLLANPITQNPFFWVHVDAVCMALGLAAGLALHARVSRGWAPGLLVSAVATILAIATKQLAVTLVPAMLLWLWREGQVRLAGRWFYCLVLVGGLFSLMFGLLFGMPELLFNLWLIHDRTPYEGGWGRLLLLLQQLVEDSWFWWIFLSVIMGLLRSAYSLGSAGRSTPLVRLLGWMALCQIPLGFLAAMKVGGGLNSVHALTYALVAVLILLGRAWRSGASSTGAGFRRLILAILLAAGLAENIGLVRLHNPVWTPYRGQEELVAISRSGPGRFYFPWDPLVTIITEHRVYPFDDALLCLSRADLEPPPDVIRAAVPPGAVLMYQEPSQSHFAFKYFGIDQPTSTR